MLKRCRSGSEIGRYWVCSAVSQYISLSLGLAPGGLPDGGHGGRSGGGVDQLAIAQYKAEICTSSSNVLLAGAGGCEVELLAQSCVDEWHERSIDAGTVVPAGGLLSLQEMGKGGSLGLL